LEKKIIGRLKETAVKRKALLVVGSFANASQLKEGHWWNAARMVNLVTGPGHGRHQNFSRQGTTERRGVGANGGQDWVDGGTDLGSGRRGTSHNKGGTHLREVTYRDLLEIKSGLESSRG